jgi:hypothetical protein
MIPRQSRSGREMLESEIVGGNSTGRISWSGLESRSDHGETRVRIELGTYPDSPGDDVFIYVSQRHDGSHSGISIDVTADEARYLAEELLRYADMKEDEA